ncbi:MAG: hypothetical protein AMS15_07260 [Planctomycetes bacterium DG_23]|nr:MAG: hypothetical protein AMS15_07260 [Planctomycetes bacterium DG_23]
MAVFFANGFIRVPGISAFIHPIWILAAIVFGVAAGYLGLLRYLQVKGKGGLLPGRFNPKAHIAFGALFLVLLSSGFLWGIWTAHRYHGAIARSFHFYLGVVILILYAIGAVIGFLLTRGIKARRRWAFIHMCFNYSACTLLGLQVILGILLLREYL